MRISCSSKQKDALQQAGLAGIVLSGNEVYAAQFVDFKFVEDAIIPLCKRSNMVAAP